MATGKVESLVVNYDRELLKRLATGVNFDVLRCTLSLSLHCFINLSAYPFKIFPQSAFSESSFFLYETASTAIWEERRFLLKLGNLSSKGAAKMLPNRQ